MNGKEVKIIRRELRELRSYLLPKAPPKFSAADLVKSFFGAILVGLTFTFKGLLFEISLALKQRHLILIVLVTLLILTLEIYYIGYAKVTQKHRRKFGQFWLKRILTFYTVAIITTFILLYTYGIIDLVGAPAMWKLVIAISLPCAVGAALGDLLEKY